MMTTNTATYSTAAKREGWLAGIAGAICDNPRAFRAFAAHWQLGYDMAQAGFTWEETSAAAVKGA